MTGDRRAETFGPVRACLAGADAARLRRLLADCLAIIPARDPVPLVGLMRVLADAAGTDASIVSDEGLVLLHESQTIKAFRPLLADTPLVGTGRWVADADAATVFMSAADAGGNIVAELETRLRRAPASILADNRAAGVAARTGPAAAEFLSAPLSAAEVGLYAELANDFSAIHINPDLARSAGLPAPVVHGMLLAGLAEAAIQTLCAQGRIADLRVRFLAPVFVSERAKVAVMDRGASARGRRWRAFVATESNVLACIADAVIES